MFFRFFVLLGLLAASAEVTASETCPTNMELGNPGGADITLCHDGYAVGYSYQHKIPMWCAYWIERETVDVNVERQDRFVEHPQIPAQYSSTRQDYSKSGFDRGHCAPSASIDYSAEANQETFFYTNMFPQKPGLNRDMFGHKGAWGYLENEIRSWARNRDQVYVISGAYVGPNAPKIGNGVSVPTHFFKVVVSPIGPEVIAFWIPHKEDAKYEVASYLTSVDDIERKTGLDLMSLLEDSQEDQLESQISDKLW